MAQILQFAPAPQAPTDAPHRALALDTTRSFIVEAPAGSGKTGLLIQRFLKLLATVSDPAQVLAITFTRKATHEMRDRVLAQLSAAADETTPSNPFDDATRPHALAVLHRDRQLNWQLLQHPERLNISTIDALCAQIARTLPVLTGSGGQSPTEDAAPLYTAAVRQTLAPLGGPDLALSQALETLLLHRDGDLANCEALIAQMLESRDQWANLIPLNPAQLTDEYLETKTLPRLNRTLAHAITAALTHLHQTIPANLLADLADLARTMASSPGYEGSPSPIAVCQSLTAAPTAAVDQLPLWRALAHLLLTQKGAWRSPKGINKKNVAFEIEPSHKAELIDLLALCESIPNLREAFASLTTLPPATYPPEQWLVAKALFRILSHALVELQLVFADRAQCDFTQLSLLARTALNSTSALDDFQNNLGFRLEHLLVDEMQDTSNSQYELIRLLTQHWDGHSQTVFLVGDPKQSIYLFRQARVERFLQTLASCRLGDLPLTPLHLTTNFRSQANLVHDFNTTFTAIFPSAGSGEEVVPHPRAVRVGLVQAADLTPETQIHYRPAIAHNPPTPNSPSLEWHTAILAYEPDSTLNRLNKSAQARTFALELASRVVAFRAKQLAKPAKIAVLVANRSHLRPILTAFDEARILYRALKIIPLAQRPEILDLLSLLRALLHPADRTAWLALLRSPFCGLTLTDLHLLCGQDDPAHASTTILQLIETRGDLLSEDGIERLQPFYATLTAALALRTSLPLTQLLHRTWQAFGAAPYTTPEAHANIESLFQLIDTLEETGPWTLPDLDAALDKLYAAPSLAEDAVDLLTIHGAKGLEWDAVFVPALEGRARPDDKQLLNWIEMPETTPTDLDDPDIAHGMIAPVEPKGADAYQLTQWMGTIRREQQAAERKRLFYVACTRARQQLHLYATTSLSKGSQKDPAHPICPANSLLTAAWPAALPHLEATLPPDNSLDYGTDLDLAAAAALTLVTPPAARTLQRIPNTFNNAGHPEPGAPRLAYETWAGPPQTASRPTGTVAARAFGTALHILLESLTQHLATGVTPESLTAQLPTWPPRIAALLTSLGTPAPDRPAAATALLTALTRTLADPTGRWLLAPHPESRTEHPIATPTGQIRLDRTFLAGPTPLSTGQTHLWIIDYKTSTPPPNMDIAAFLTSEKETYAPQLAAYATHLTQRNLPIHLALYHPTLTTLTWWPYTPPNSKTL